MNDEKKKAKKVVPVKEGKKGQNVAKVTNHFLLPVALIEALIAAGVCVLNYVLRYEPDIREECSMVNWEGVTLWCSDLPKLAKPVYNETSRATIAVTFQVPEWVFFTCAIVVPLSLVLVVELAKSMFSSKNIKAVSTARLTLKPVFRRIPRYICTFIMGGAIVGSVVSILKLLIASPRPNFLEVCAPNSTLVDACNNSFIWSPVVTCEGDDALVHEALRAFPSYHAALAVYCGIWTIVYLSATASVSGVYSVKLLIIGAVVVITSIGTTHQAIIGMSSGNDLLVGGIMGAITAFYVTLVVLNGFKERNFKVKVVKALTLENLEHPNMLPIIPLHGAEKQPQELRFANDADDRSNNDDNNSEDEDFDYDYLAITSDTFPYLPRATSHKKSRYSPVAARRSPTQAVNSNFNGNAPISPPPPPPPPLPSQQTTLGPPPSYTRIEPMSAYNVPRQRYSAPVRPPQAPDYDGARSNVLNAYYSHDSDTLPRARTETSSYF